MIPLLDFFQTSQTFPSFLWKGRGSPKAYLGYGTHQPSTFTFKAQAFQGDCTGIWDGFPTEWSYSPSQLISADWTPVNLKPQLPRCVKREDSPSFETWEKVVKDACRHIELGTFRKVVLARQTTLTFDGEVSPHELLKGIMALGEHTSLFMIQLDSSTAFMGASPEKLFTRLGKKIATEALAGTINSADTWSPKEFSEVDAVRVYLQQQLMPCCQDLRWGMPEERSFGSLRHLYQKLEGILKEKISDATLVSQLHPTPALGGFPKNEALDYIREKEMFVRGWYGAPIGLISELETDLAVAIRSFLVRGNQVHLFAGAGIVKGSIPRKEWEELDAKIAHVLRWAS